MMLIVSSLGCSLDASLLGNSKTPSLIDDLDDAVSMKICANGPVFSQVQLPSGGTIYGGDFNYIGRCSNSFFLYNPSTGLTDEIADSGVAVGETYAIEPDGAGGFYLGGTFRASNGAASLIHVTAAGVATSWNPNLSRADGELPVVYALRVHGGRIYVGGRFDYAGSASIARTGLAAFDLGTGEIVNWAPPLTVNSDGELYVRLIEISGASLYIAGAFEDVGANAHNSESVAKLNMVDENADTLFTATGRSSAALKLKVHNGVLLLNDGGNVVTLDASTGVDTGWKSSLTFSPGWGNFSDYVISGNELWIGGSFDSIDGHSSKDLMKFDFSGATPTIDTSWSTAYEPESWVDKLILTDSHILTFANGTIGYFNRSNGTQFVPTNEMPIGEDDFIDGISQGENLIVGTKSRTVFLPERRHLAMFDADGSLTSWNPAPNNDIYSVLVHEGRIFVGGRFTDIGVSPSGVSYLAELDMSGEVVSWSANAAGAVNEMHIIDDSLFVAGGFTSIGLAGDGPAYLAKLNLDDASAFAWDSQVDQEVQAFDVYEDKLFVGGGFTSIAGQPASNFAAIDVNDGSWIGGTPAVDNWVNGVVVLGSTVYIGGDFANVGAEARNELAALDVNSGVVSSWAPDVTFYAFRVLRKFSDKITVMAHFNEVDGHKYREGMLTLETNGETQRSSGNIYFTNPWGTSF